MTNCKEGLSREIKLNPDQRSTAICINYIQGDDLIKSDAITSHLRIECEEASGVTFLIDVRRESNGDISVKDEKLLGLTAEATPPLAPKK